MDQTVPSLAPDGRQLRVELPFLPEAVPQARSIVRAHGAAYPPYLVADAELLTSEMVSNAVMHGAPPLYLAVVAGEDHLSVEVTDGSDVLPPFPTVDSDPDSVSGRGLRIVQLLASGWGIAVSGPGKTMWFRVAGTREQPAHTDSNDPEETPPWT